MASAVSMNNELLSLWLKAGAGLPADEARELVERLAAMEAEHEAEIDALDAAHAQEMREAAEGTAAYDEGHAEGRHEAAILIRRAIDGPGWGKAPTKADLIAALRELASELSGADV